MQTKTLTIEEFKATRRAPKRVEDSKPPENFWEYVSAIPPEDFGVFDCRAGEVTHVYRMGDEYEHVLINSQFQGVAMVVVVDLPTAHIYGHYLLDLNPPGTEVPTGAPN